MGINFGCSQQKKSTSPTANLKTQTQDDRPPPTTPPLRYNTCTTANIPSTVVGPNCTRNLHAGGKVVRSHLENLVAEVIIIMIIT